MRMTLHFDTETEGDEDRYTQAVAADELAVALWKLENYLTRAINDEEDVWRYDALQKVLNAYVAIMNDYPLAQNAVESLD